MAGNMDMISDALELEKQRVKKANHQISFLEKEIEVAKDKGLEVATKFKSELVKSLQTTKTLQSKQEQMEIVLRKMKTELNESQAIIRKLAEENKKQKNRIKDLEDVTSFQDKELKKFK